MGAPVDIFRRPEHAAVGHGVAPGHRGNGRLFMGSVAHVHRPVAPASFDLELDRRLLYLAVFII